MKTVLVTGSAGFIGSRTCHLLLDQGVEVIGIDCLNDAYDLRVKEHRLEGLKKRDGYINYRTNIENLEALDPIFRNHHFDVVFNLAARAGVRYSIIDPHVYMTTNANGTLNILEMMRKYELTRAIHASTSSLYAGQPLPFTEDSRVDTPLSPYAASKKAAETLCATYQHLYGFDTIVLRYFTVYGPAGRPDMAPFRFIKWIDEGTPITVFGDGKQTRDFTFVDDIARGTVMAAGLSGYDTINLGGGKRPIALLDFIHLIEERLGKKAEIDWQPMPATDMIDTSADIKKAKELMDWEPEFDLPEGLDQTVGWYLENRDWVKEVQL
ncbi:MAG: NAD-dependent epimerase/dehydratase family protein [Verrucomicrobiota bacterium]